MLFLQRGIRAGLKEPAAAWRQGSRAGHRSDGSSVARGMGPRRAAPGEHSFWVSRPWPPAENPVWSRRLAVFPLGQWGVASVRHPEFLSLSATERG